MWLSPFICRRMTAGGLAVGLYGLWLAFRLPGDLPLATRLASWAWALGLCAGAGMVLAGTAAALATGAGRLFRPSRSATAAATVETLVLVPFVTWLALNEAVYQLTSEVVGYQTVLMIWANPAATLEGAWEMAGRYVLALSAAVLLVCAAAWRVSRRSFRAFWCPVEQAARPKRSLFARRGTAGSMTGGLALLAGLLAWQFHSRPSEALTVVCRSAPPLRALNLTRSLLGDGLLLTARNDLALGGPILSEADYRAFQGVPRSPAPNVVVIVLESVPAKALHCYGHPRADITPHLDRLAADGVLFEHCIATGSFSSYGLVSLMTSLHMLRAPSNDHFTDTSFPFLGLPRALKLAGYELALFSSGNEAFDNLHRFYPPSDFDAYFSLDVADVPKPDCMRLPDHYAIERFEAWMAARSHSRPFYCGFYLQSTHFNYEVPQPWASHYQPVPPLYSNGSGILQIPPDVLPLLKNQYDNSMRYSDYWVGRIRSSLERAGAFDNSVVVVVADHGEAFMEHGLARHGVALWEEMIHVPFLIHVGAAARERLGRVLPSRVAGTVSGIDMAPTIAGLVGFRAHPSWQGVDTLAPGYSSQDRPLFSVLQLTKWQEAVVLNGFKYIYDVDELKAQLFDLSADPGETTDLADRRPDLARALRDVLAAWHTRQLRYYAARPFTRYLGPFEPGADRLDRFRAAAGEPGSVAWAPRGD